MVYLAEALPLLLLAGIIALILNSALRGRLVLRRPAVRKPQPRAKSVAPLRMVSPDQMDADLQDLIRKS
jgi:hypothetical protein